MCPYRADSKLCGHAAARPVNLSEIGSELGVGLDTYSSHTTHPQADKQEGRGRNTKYIAITRSGQAPTYLTDAEISARVTAHYVSPAGRRVQRVNAEAIR
jgi:hypothetical protein